jgi:hypothetical protein
MLYRLADTWRPPALGDAKVTVLEQLLEWSRDRPAWQRDALRRLAWISTAQV